MSGFLKSRKTAIALILIFLALLCVSVFIPQKTYYSQCEIDAYRLRHPGLMDVAERLSLDDVFGSPFFPALMGMLILSLLFCTGQRAVKLFFSDYFESGGADAARGDKDGTRPAAKRRKFFNAARAGMAGSIIFHLSIPVITMGFLGTSLFGFKATVTMTEGQTLPERHDAYGQLVEGSFFFENHKFFNITLDSVKRTFDGGYLTDMVCNVTAEGGGGERIEGAIRVNEPFSYQGVEYVISDSGYTPRFVLRQTGSGRQVFKSYVNISSSSQDFFDVPETGLRVFSRFAPPTASAPARVGKTGVFDVFGDSVRIKIMDMGAKPPKVLFKGEAVKGGFVKAGGYEFGFDDVRSWVIFRVARDPGRQITFIGFWLCAAGALIRFMPFRVENKRGANYKKDSDGAESQNNNTGEDEPRKI